MIRVTVYVAGHEPRHRRKTLGRAPISNRTLIGWDARCECGWEQKTNEKKAVADQLHREHVASYVERLIEEDNRKGF